MSMMDKYSSSYNQPSLLGEGWGAGNTHIPSTNTDFLAGTTLASGSNYGKSPWGGDMGIPSPANGGFDWGSIFSKDGLLGSGSSALGALQGIGNLYMGMKQYGLAKKSLAQSRDQFNKNYEAQRKSTNSHMEDRQRARVAANPNAVGVDEYMAKNRI